MPFEPGLDADGQACVEAFLEVFETRFSAMLAANAKLEIVARAPGKSIVAANAALRQSIESAPFEDLRIAQTLGLGCALDSVDDVALLLQATTDDLTAGGAAVVEIGAALGAGG